MAESTRFAWKVVLLAPLAVAALFGLPGISAAAVPCAARSASGPGCIALPAGHVGFEMAILIDDETVIFAPGELKTSGGPAVTQDAAGAIVLSQEPCTGPTRQCLSLVVVHAVRPGPIPAGTVVNFKVLRVSGLPAENTVALCRLEGTRTIRVVDMKGATVSISTASVGDNRLTLRADQPDGMRIHCEVTSTFLGN